MMNVTKSPPVTCSALLEDHPGNAPGLTYSEITDEMATFLPAGHEASANASARSLVLRPACPVALERLEEELGSVLGDPPPDEQVLSPTKRPDALLSVTGRPHGDLGVAVGYPD
jgi:cytochrome P450